MANIGIDKLKAEIKNKITDLNFEDVDFTGYSGYREQLVSYDGEYYKKEILPELNW